MPDFPESLSSGWSKDFVEHIRTVHFSLIAICLALIGLLQFQKPKDLSGAQRQLTDIKNAVDGWDSAQVTGAVRDTLMKAGAFPAMIAPGPSTRLFKIATYDMPVAFAPTPCILTSQDNLPKSCTDPLEVTSANSQFLRKPASLAEFRDWWNFLSRDPSLIKPDPNKVSKSAFSIDQSGHLKVLHYSPVPSPSPSPNSSMMQSPSISPNPPVSSFSIPSVRFLTSQEAALIHSASTAGPLDLAYSIDDSSSKRTILIPVEIGSRTTISAQASLIATHPYWRPGSFSTAFKDLDDASSQMQGQSLDAIASYFAAQAVKAHEPDSFEVFGVKFPIETASAWGIALIIGVQLYFWVHLLELSPRLGEKDEGWNVAWIGVYPRLPARIVYLMSVVALPLITMGLLGNHALRAHQSLILVLVYSFGFVGSALLAFLAARSTPKRILSSEQTTTIDSDQISANPTSDSKSAVLLPDKDS
ncbi:hypothetical protein DYQ86_05150 [Acidobacteria bacterium AB60]|nr:hypothetical protein DYQ86_05150 [Acidobacteria bacterium AB60]